MGRWRSGQSHLTVNQAALCLRRFESCPAHQDENSPCCNRDCFRLADRPAGSGVLERVIAMECREDAVTSYTEASSFRAGGIGDLPR